MPTDKGKTKVPDSANLGESEHLYRDLVECCADGVWRCDVEGRFTYVSPSLRPMFGFEPNEVIGKPFGLLLTEESAKAARESIAKRLRGELGYGVVVLELTHRRKDGSEFPGETRSVPLRDPDGTICGVQGITRDISERVRAEEALYASEKRFRTLVETSPMGIMQDTPEGGTVYVNPAMCELFGVEDPEELEGLNWESFFTEQSLKTVRTHSKKRLKGIATNYEVEIVTKQGETRNLIVHGAPLLSADGELQGTIATFMDITERKLAEEALQKSEKRFRQIAENAGEWIWEVDAKGLYTYGSPVVEDILGYRPEEVVGKKHFYDFFLPEDRQELKEAAFSAFASKQAFRGFVNRNIAKNGDIVWLSTSGIAILDEDGHLLRYRGADADITERTRAEQALRESEERFQELFDNAPVGYHELDREGRIVRINNTELAMLGFTQEEMLGRYVWEFVVEQEASRTAVLGKLEGRLRAGRALERTYRKKDGAGVPILVEDRVLGGPDGEITGIRSTIQDITERKQAEEKRRELERQIQHAQKLESLGVLAGGIAHDFNNILMVVIGNAELALHDLSPVSPARQSLEAIELAAKRAADLSRQMLAYSGRGALIFQPVDLNEVVREMEHLLRSSISKKADLACHFTQNLPAVEGDATQLRQIIMNLITNASEAIGDDEGVIRITTAPRECTSADLVGDYAVEELPAGRYVFIEVSDTGCGMDEDTRAKLFDPFFTTKFTGRGLGLSAVLGIVRGHRGVIQVDSVLGEGSTFTVLLPASERPAVEEGPEDTGEQDVRGAGAILVVDDEAGIRILARRNLEKAGFDVLEARDGREAVEVFRERRQDIAAVLLDLTMPGLSGAEALRQMQERDPDVPIVLTSGYPEDKAREALEGNTPAGFIQKPWEAEKLVQQMLDVLQG